MQNLLTELMKAVYIEAWLDLSEHVMAKLHSQDNKINYIVTTMN